MKKMLLIKKGLENEIKEFLYKTIGAVIALFVMTVIAWGWWLFASWLFGLF